MPDARPDRRAQGAAVVISDDELEDMTGGLAERFNPAADPAAGLGCTKEEAEAALHELGLKRIDYV